MSTTSLSIALTPDDVKDLVQVFDDLVRSKGLSAMPVIGKFMSKLQAAQEVAAEGLASSQLDEKAYLRP